MLWSYEYWTYVDIEECWPSTYAWNNLDVIRIKPGKVDRLPTVLAPHKMSKQLLFWALFFALIKLCENANAGVKPTFLTILPPSITGRHTKELLANRFRYRLKNRKVNGLYLEFKIYAMESKSPDEVLSIFADTVINNGVNTIFLVNTEESSELALSDYITRLAESIGIPLITWDPTYIGPLQVRSF